jgi:hypothetical protein
VYHPADFNNRLVLRMKGTMSEADLHLIRSRLTAGLKHKAAKGELRQGLPVGLGYDEDDKVVLCADEGGARGDHHGVLLPTPRQFAHRWIWNVRDLVPPRRGGSDVRRSRE